METDDNAAPAVVKGNSGHSGYARAKLEWYVEGPREVYDLLDREAFDGGVHDPACGAGNIPLCCHARGLLTSGSDIVDRGYGRQQDFFASHERHDNIITNPPFKCSVAFTLHALEVARRKVVVLQRLNWLEGQTRGRELFDMGMLERVWVFRRRISLPPGGTSIAAVGGKLAYCWYVFNKDHRGPWQGGWIA